MSKERTLREKIETQKKIRKVKKAFLFTILPFVILTLAFSIGFSNANTEGRFLGLFDKQEAKIEEEIPSLELKIIDNKEDDSSEETNESNLEEDSTEETVKQTLNSRVQQTPNNNTDTPPVTEGSTFTETKIVPEDNCTEYDISFHKQLISTAEAQIVSSQNYINNPSCDSTYTPSRCQLSYDICKSDVERWFEADGTCSRLPRSSFCDKLKIERYNKLLVCEQEFNTCNAICEEQITNRLIEKHLLIEDANTRIQSYKNFLRGCGVNL